MTCKLSDLEIGTEFEWKGIRLRKTTSMGYVEGIYGYNCERFLGNRFQAKIALFVPNSAEVEVYG